MVRQGVKARMPTFVASFECIEVGRAVSVGMPECRQGGFTLVELLVVFAIAALLIGVMPFAVSRFQDSVEYRNTVRLMLSVMTDARRASIANGRSVAFELDLRDRRFGLEGAMQHRLPGNLDIAVDVAATELTGDRFARIRFFPEGGATGGSIVIRRSVGDGVRIRADWLFGRITQEPL